MTVLDMVIRTMRKGEYVTHYKKRKCEFLLEKQ